jgi:hypothetical protein
MITKQRSLSRYGNANMRLLHLTHAKPRKDYEVGFVLVAVRVFVPPTRPGKNCPVESGDAYMYATVVP